MCAGPPRTMSVPVKVPTSVCRLAGCQASLLHGLLRDLPRRHHRSGDSRQHESNAGRRHQGGAGERLGGALPRHLRPGSREHPSSSAGQRLNAILFSNRFDGSLYVTMCVLKSSRKESAWWIRRWRDWAAVLMHKEPLGTWPLKM